MDLSRLSQEVVTAILSHIPLDERLSSCALVSNNWSSAAAAASSTLVVHLTSQAQADSLSVWLARHAASIQHLEVATDPGLYMRQQIEYREAAHVAIAAALDAGRHGPVPFGSEQPRPQRFVTKLPLQHLTSLQSLCLQQVQIHSDSWSDSLAAAGTAAAPDAAAAAGVDDGDGPIEQSQLTRFVIDSCIGHLFWVVRGNGFKQLCCNVEEFEVRAGPLDSSTQGQEWGTDFDVAFVTCLLKCGRLRTLRLSTKFVKAWMLENVRRDLPALDYVDLHIPGGLPKRLASLKPWLQRLPGQQLTRLVLRPLANRDTGKVLDLGPSSIDLLSTFNHLRHLEISGGTLFEPSTLAPLTALTHLQLKDVDRCSALSSTQQQQQQQQQQEEEEGEKVLEGSAAVLAVLPYLQELRHLELSPGLLPPPYCPPEQYSTLTSSSHLTHLDLYHCQLAAGAAAALFGNGRSLPELRCVRMTQPPASRRDWGVRSGGFGCGGQGNPAGGLVAAAVAAMGADGSSSSSSAAGPPFGTSSSIASLVCCCPAVEQLWLTAAVAPGVDLKPLNRLARLTELQLGGEVVGDSVAEGVLGGLSQLQRLDVVECPRFTDAGLVHLTGLQQLTSLQVRECGLSPVTTGPRHTLYMCSKTEGSLHVTPVHERLHQLCLNSRDCLLAMLAQRDKQLAAAAAATAAAEARAAAAEALAAADARI